MILGHIGLALAAKKWDPKTSLGWLLLASLWVDLLGTVLLLFGIETIDIDPLLNGVWPVMMDQIGISHSLLMVIIWAVLLGRLFRYHKGRESLTIVFLIVSHWILDFIFFRHDLPITPFTDLSVGMGLWNSINLSIMIQFGLLIMGIGVYAYTVKSEHLKIKPQFWVAMIVIAGAGLGAMITVPQTYDAAIRSWAMVWLLVPTGFWIDHKRPETYQAIR